MSNKIACVASAGDGLSNEAVEQARAELAVDKLQSIPNIENIVVNNGAIIHAWRRPKYASIANIPENDEVVDWDRLTELEFATKMKKVLNLDEILIFTETNCYHFDVGEVKTVSDVCGIVTQWRVLGSKRTELYRYFDMLFNLYFGSVKRCKAQGVFGEGTKANDIFRILLKLDSPTYRSAILKNLEVLLYQPESSIPWNQHPEWFV